MPAGSSRAVRLDPLALPVRFTASDAGADERVRWVELDRERVVLRRAVRGIPMAIKLPVNAFLGVALHLVATEGGERVTLSLEHRDPALSVPLFSQADGNDVIADWQLWARTLGLPLLVGDRGNLREPFERMGGVRLEPVCPRRRRRNAVKARRPSILLRRALAPPARQLPVHRGEREIIARS
jgi:hypothetical protein